MSSDSCGSCVDSDEVIELLTECLHEYRVALRAAAGALSAAKAAGIEASVALARVEDALDRPPVGILEGLIQPLLAERERKPATPAQEERAAQADEVP